MKKIIILSIVALMCSAQSFAQKSYQEFCDAQARVGDGIAEVHIKPMIAEVERIGNKRFEDKFDVDVATVIGLGGDIANIRAWVTYLATEKISHSKEYNFPECDIIMNPLFKIENNKETKDGSLVVTIVGYPGKFVNWHTATSQDFDWLVNERTWRKGERESVAPVVKE